ncbi:Uncharacterised protein [Vibrio cholerae]|nr:Uncharacterised protein [Vibrio cholerae]
MHHILRADKKRYTLVQLSGFDIHDAMHTIRSETARLLNQKRHWVALIEQTQFTVRVALRARVQIDAAFKQVAMEIRHQ